MTDRNPALDDTPMTDDEIKSMEEVDWSHWMIDPDETNRLLVSLKAARAQIAAALALHHKDSNGFTDMTEPICCQECGSWWSDRGMAGYPVKWPCPTVRALTGETP